MKAVKALDIVKYDITGLKIVGGIYVLWAVYYILSYDNESD